MRFLLFIVAFLFLSTPVWAESLAEPPVSGPARDIWTHLQPDSPLAQKKTLNLKELDPIYKIRDYRPVWDIKDKKNQEALQTFLEDMQKLVYYNGLAPQNEVIATFIVQSQHPDDVDHTTFDIALTDWLLTIAHELNGDAINYKLLFKSWAFEPTTTQLAEKLGEALYHGQAYDFLLTLTPATIDYLLLARSLRLYRAIAQQQPWKPIDQGTILRAGDRSIRVRQTRQRLEAEAYMLPICRDEKEELYFDRDLQKIIVEYQSRNGLETDGNIGPETINALNKSVEERINQIRANMAFARAMPRQFPDRLAYVNIADASIKIYKDHEVIHHAQTVVGLPSRKTPFISSAIDTVIMNPGWNIPISIARYDILPKLRKNPYYLQEKGYAIRGREEDPYGLALDFSQMEPRQFNFRLRQSPGPKNALGEIKFDFKNPFSVYLHGTPHKEDFGTSKRHKSSGCIRLKDPPEIASIILADNQEPWSYEEIQNEIGNIDVFRVNVDKPLPIFVVYRSVFVPSDGAPLHFRRDIYSYDKRLIDAIDSKVKQYSALFSNTESEEEERNYLQQVAETGKK